MLAPDIHQTKTLLTTSFNEILQIDGYAHGTRATTVGRLPKDPAWLPAVRSRIAMLSGAAGDWTLARPDIWAPVLVQFLNYVPSVQSIAQQQAAGTITTAEQWSALLRTVLLKQTSDAISATQQAERTFQQHYEAFKAIQPLLQNSIDAGWQALADEEAQMTKIAAALATLQQKVESLESQLTSDAISDGKSYISSSVSITYELVSTAGVSIPFLSIGAVAITVGMMFYHIIANTAEIADDLQQIADLQVEASQEAQAAAGTKAVLQALYQSEENFLSLQDALPQLVALWQAEHDKLQAAVEALDAGADVATFLELVTLPTANTNWQAIGAFVQSISDMQPTYGLPVVLQPGKPPIPGASPVSPLTIV